MSAFNSRSARAAAAAASTAAVLCVDEDDCEQVNLNTASKSAAAVTSQALQPASRPVSAAPAVAGRRKASSATQQELVLENDSDEDQPSSHRIRGAATSSTHSKSAAGVVVAGSGNRSVTSGAWSIPARSAWTDEGPAEAAATSSRPSTTANTAIASPGVGRNPALSTCSSNGSRGVVSTRASRARSTAGSSLCEEEFCEEQLSDAVAATHISGPSRAAAPTAGAVLHSTHAAGAPPPAATAASITPLSLEQERLLEQLLWGGAAQQWPESWQQGLQLSEVEGLWWGLVQHQGGPCGVLAAIQGHLMAVLLEQGLLPGQALPQQQLQQHLVAALATILWTARAGQTAAVVAPSSSCIRAGPGSSASSSSSSSSSSSGPTGRAVGAGKQQGWQVYMAENVDQLKGLLQATSGSWCGATKQGLRLLLFSLLFTHTPAAVKADMDDSSTPLIAAHGYCSMELVNLCLTGVAVSNVFDGNRDLDEAMCLKGVAGRSRVGLLTLFEWYRYVEVGSHLKRPLLPVWVVCSESHFSTLWLPPAAAAPPTRTASQQQQQQQVDKQRPLTLHYYDGLARQEAPILLHVAAAPAAQGGGWTSRLAGVNEERGTWQGQPIPPLECVLETKWPDSRVTWEGSEPLL